MLRTFLIVIDWKPTDHREDFSINDFNSYWLALTDELPVEDSIGNPYRANSWANLKSPLEDNPTGYEVAGYKLDAKFVDYSFTLRVSP